jgi:hypothetical protein
MPFVDGIVRPVVPMAPGPAPGPVEWARRRWCDPRLCSVRPAGRPPPGWPEWSGLQLRAAASARVQWIPSDGGGVVHPS